MKVVHFEHDLFYSARLRQELRLNLRQRGHTYLETQNFSELDRELPNADVLLMNPLEFDSGVPKHYVTRFPSLRSALVVADRKCLRVPETTIIFEYQEVRQILDFIYSGRPERPKAG